MNELQMEEEIKASLKTARADIDFFSKLLETPGWKRLQEVANAQVDNRIERLCSAAENALAAQGTSSDFEKGQIQGIKLFMQLPEMALRMAKDTLNKYEVTDEPAQEN